MVQPTRIRRRRWTALASSFVVHAVVLGVLPAPQAELEPAPDAMVLVQAPAARHVERDVSDGEGRRDDPGAASAPSGLEDAPRDGANAPAADTTPSAEPDPTPSSDPSHEPGQERHGALEHDRVQADPTPSVDPLPPQRPEPERPLDPRYEAFVWTDPQHETPNRAATHVIAAHDVSDPVRARPTADEGDPGPVLDGVRSRRSGTPRPVVARNDAPAAKAAGKIERPDAPTEVDDSVVDDPAETPAQGTGTRELKARAVVALPTEAQRQPVLSDAGVRHTGTPRTSEASGELRTELPVPDWWVPLAARVTGQRAPNEVIGTPIPPVPEQRIAPQDRLPDPTRMPEQRDVPDDRDEDPTPIPETEIAAHDAEARAEISGGADPADLTEPFAVRRAIKASFDEATDVEEASVTARRTPLGEWTHQVTGLLRTRWSQAELPALDRAFGLKGTVVIAFRVARSGRVRDIEIVEASGNAMVDAHARLVIPERLPRPPVKADVAHRVAFEVR